MLYIPWMVILGDHNIKKKGSKTSIFELSKVKNCKGKLCTGPFTQAIIGGNSHFASLARALTGPRQVLFK